MSTNKYRRRRTMRTPTAGTKYQNEPIQAPLQKVEQSSSFNDLGREDARRISKQNNPNTLYVDKPTATMSKRQLSDAMSRQQAVIRNAQRQVLGSKAVPQLKLSGTFAAPSIPQSQLVFKGGSVCFQPRANLVTAVAGVASQMLVEPLSDVISDNIIFPLMEKALGRDIPSAAEIRRLQQQGEQVSNFNDAEVNALPQASPESSVMPLNPIDDAATVRIRDSTPLEAILKGVEETHSLSPEGDERNREYLIRRAALGEKPTQEEMRAVVECCI